MHNGLLLMAFHWWSLEKYLISSLNVLFLLWKFTIVSKICSNFAKKNSVNILGFFKTITSSNVCQMCDGEDINQMGYLQLEPL
jgi:hypothetical protein